MNNEMIQIFLQEMDATINVENGFICTSGSSSSTDTWNSICGDGYRVGLEKWDDANTNSGDGCDYQCNVETGYSCTGGSSSSTDTWNSVCGDGLKIGNEQWDDANTYSGDGCDLLYYN